MSGWRYELSLWLRSHFVQWFWIGLLVGTIILSIIFGNAADQANGQLLTKQQEGQGHVQPLQAM